MQVLFGRFRPGRGSPRRLTFAARPPALGFLVGVAVCAAVGGFEPAPNGVGRVAPPGPDARAAIRARAPARLRGEGTLSEKLPARQPPPAPPPGELRASVPTRRSFDGVRTWSAYVVMRDGVRLAVDVHLPRGLAPGERTATILHLSRYYRSVRLRPPVSWVLGAIYPITERDLRERFVKAGYSWVDADVRGAGASFGVQDYPLSADEVRDGADLVQWIVRQPWSAGVVGATGTSYDGTLASLLVRGRHPALKAIAPRFSGWDVYGDIFFPGGLRARSLLTDWARLTRAFDSGRLRDIFGWPADLVAGGVNPVDPQALPRAMAEHAKNVDLEMLLRGVVFRDDPDPRGRPVTMDDFSPHAVDDGEVGAVPIYAYGGWFDGALARGQIRHYLANRHRGSRLRLGPWFHAGEFNASPYAGGRKERFDHAGELRRFFDHHLRGGDDGFRTEAPVHYYTMGDERWKTAPTWPPPGARWQTWRLAPGGRLHFPGAAPEGDRSAHLVDRYRVDPAVTTGPGARWGLVVGTGMRRGYGDRRAVDRRLLAYTSPPLPGDLEVTGHPIVRLFLSATGTDGAVFVYLEEVRPHGEVRYVTEGQVRLIHRQLGRSPLPGDPVPFRSYRRADARPLVPGEVAEVVIDLLPTSFVFRAGHAIRLAIAGADAEHFDVPLPVSPLVYEIHSDPDHPSRLELPVYRSPGRFP